MADLRDLLIEIGTEELPPKALFNLSLSFEQGIRDGLEKAGLPTTAIRRFATPRRLAVLIEQLPTQQPDRQLERRGPALSAAFAADGRPTKAAEGFARSCGVAVAELQQQETDKGVWLVHVNVEPGAATADLIPGIVLAALAALPIPKRMRWGDREDEFVRPVHWAVLLFGDEVIPATIMGVQTGRETRGHRFHHPALIRLTAPADYARQLAGEGKVITDFGDRRDAIRAQAEAAAAALNGIVVIKPELLDEVAALVEWPVALAGNFEPRFLEVPAEALISTMQDHQRYFPVVDAHGRLLPHFITITNLESRDPAQVRAGNERVIRPRFSDAEFFWNQDRKQPLAARMESLKQVVFQQRLGTLADKSERVAALARLIAEQSQGNPEWAERAARLAKCDLLTQMVQEFPELQGIMGRYYALHDQEAREVAQAQEEQYLPRFAGDRLPTTATGRTLALAERLDTLIGIFAIGQAPSGAKDPFALRRAALGVLRIVIEGELDLDLQTLLERAATRFDPAIRAENAVETVFEFIMDRLRSYYLDQGVLSDTFEAVLDCRPTRPLDFDRRVHAVSAFRERPEAARLAAANKRIRNLLKKVATVLPFEVRPDLLIEDAEQALAGRLVELSSEVIPLMETGLYGEALNRLARLREPVDAFFDQVLVMADDPVLRDNRIALLNELSSLFLRVADFSRLQD
ncbi:glycine--tRNA ligase subunit beta [Candidatus Contendibacter odensensis]|uniref:Glycine--tRNA ligase beta subunit n=1 Tax=Candidatus Contendobacter odensis Run_B_J11 TaxID=1400861 RepID=A0A7U7J644_9GAMM|nr:glycine--tRNA ligase subunit beta [Candidatus Contendobacter odensis]CDH47653.1 glycine tRNA synthetase, beta subunit [Candidatus Contendobacter odensis Run_B_J11]